MAEYNGILADHSYFERADMRKKMSIDSIATDIDKELKTLNALIKEAESAGFKVAMWVDDMNDGTKVKATLEKELG